MSMRTIIEINHDHLHGDVEATLRDLLDALSSKGFREIQDECGRSNGIRALAQRWHGDPYIVAHDPETGNALDSLAKRLYGSTWVRNDIGGPLKRAIGMNEYALLREIARKLGAG